MRTMELGAIGADDDVMDAAAAAAPASWANGSVSCAVNSRKLLANYGGPSVPAGATWRCPGLQLLRKLLSTLDRLGCFSFLSALASICRIRSRVNANCWPASSSVWSLLMPRPKRMRMMRSSRGVSEASMCVVVSRRFDWIAASIGRITFLILN